MSARILLRYTKGFLEGRSREELEPLLAEWLRVRRETERQALANYLAKDDAVLSEAPVITAHLRLDTNPEPPAPSPRIRQRTVDETEGE